MGDVIGHGVDLVSNARIAHAVREHGDRFLQRVFTDAENAYAAASARRRVERLAARFAAKEAVLKALGTGWRSGIAWRDVEVVPRPSGSPSVRLAGRAAELAHKQGIEQWHLSLSHTEDHAIASVIAVGSERSA